ncbi:MAG: 30S ribosomal protein S18 [Verrucomicrobia bacterium]|nr:30S ribosomal protein S18 [Verrucomicrobiota bacterium]
MRNDEGGGLPLRKRSRHLDGVKEINPRDYDFIRKFMTEHGKIVPARLTGATAKQQREIKRIVRRLRVVGIVP